MGSVINIWALQSRVTCIEKPHSIHGARHTAGFITKMYFIHFKPQGVSESMWSVNLDASMSESIRPQEGIPAGLQTGCAGNMPGTAINKPGSSWDRRQHTWELLQPVCKHLKSHWSRLWTTTSCGGTLIAQLAIIANTYRSMIIKTHLLILNSLLWMYIPTGVHLVYWDWLQALLNNNLRCARKWPKSALSDELQARNRESLEIALKAVLVTLWRYTCRAWSWELKDECGDSDRASWGIHLGALMMRVWRCPCRLWSCKLGPWNQVYVGIHLEGGSEVM
jgi:hypothetical protein